MALAVIAGMAVLIGNIYYVIRSKNGKLRDEQIKQLQIDNEACNNRTAILTNDIRHLQGQVDTLRDIPLQDIRDGIKSISVTNGKILDNLKKSAVTLKNDTKEAETAVRTVKADSETV